MPWCVRISSLRSSLASDSTRPVAGTWHPPGATHEVVPDPLNGQPFLRVALADVDAFVAAAASCPPCGLHNPLHKPERYVMYGEVCAKAAAELARPEAASFFTHLIRRVMPKSDAQCAGEVAVTRTFLATFAGDGVRFLAQGV